MSDINVVRRPSPESDDSATQLRDEEAEKLAELLQREPSILKAILSYNEIELSASAGESELALQLIPVWMATASQM